MQQNYLIILLGIYNVKNYMRFADCDELIGKTHNVNCY